MSSCRRWADRASCRGRPTPSGRDDRPTAIPAASRLIGLLCGNRIPRSTWGWCRWTRGGTCRRFNKSCNGLCNVRMGGVGDILRAAARSRQDHGCGLRMAARESAATIPASLTPSYDPVVRMVRSDGVDVGLRPRFDRVGRGPYDPRPWGPAAVWRAGTVIAGNVDGSPGKLAWPAPASRPPSFGPRGLPVQQRAERATRQ